ncbi:MAG: hypothetical protein V4638_12495 [Bacteroidota bacterium]
MRNLLTYCFLLVTFLSFAQKSTSTVQPQKIQVGVPAKLKIIVELPSDASYKYTPFTSIVPARKKDNSQVLTTESSEDIEVVNSFSDTIFMKGKQKIWEGNYEITGWNEGVYEIETGTFFLNDSTMTLPTATLKVVLVSKKEGQDIYDIDEHFAELPPAGNPIILFLLDYYWLLLIFIVILLIYWRWKKVSKVDKNPPKVLSLKARILMAIDMLEAEKLWEKGKLKEHYIELSFILRSYLSSRYELNLLEKTTIETKLLLQRVGLHPETIESIEIVLMQSDLVKFAKSQPEEIEILKISQKVRMIITETSPLEYENVE